MKIYIEILNKSEIGSQQHWIIIDDGVVWGHILIHQDSVSISIRWKVDVKTFAQYVQSNFIDFINSIYTYIRNKYRLSSAI